VRNKQEAANGAKTKDDKENFPEPLTRHIQLVRQHLVNKKKVISKWEYNDLADHHV
jgi:hypothetical protein